MKFAVDTQWPITLNFYLDLLFFRFQQFLFFKSYHTDKPSKIQLVLLLAHHFDDRFFSLSASLSAGIQTLKNARAGVEAHCSATRTLILLSLPGFTGYINLLQGIQTQAPQRTIKSTAAVHGNLISPAANCI